MSSTKKRQPVQPHKTPDHESSSGTTACEVIQQHEKKMHDGAVFLNGFSPETGCFYLYPFFVTKTMID